MDNFITWRTYRDRAQAPVPVLRAQGAEAAGDARHTFLRYAYVPVVRPQGSVALVGAYERATGLYTGTVWERSDRLPAASLAAEPVLLEGGSAARPRLAVARAFEGEGDNPCLTPRIWYEGGEPMLFLPESEARSAAAGDESCVAIEIGRGTYRIPLYGMPTSISANGGTLVEHFEYDAQHGVVLLFDRTGTPIERALVTVTLTLGRSFSRTLALLAPGVYPVTRAADGYVEVRTDTDEATVLGYVLVERIRRLVDTRRLAPLPAEHADGAPGADPDRYHRVGSGYFDASPLSRGHLWIVETDAPSALVVEAVARTLPAGSLVRLEPTTRRAAAPTPTPTEAFLLTEDGAILSAEPSFGEEGGGLLLEQ